MTESKYLSQDYSDPPHALYCSLRKNEEDHSSNEQPSNSKSHLALNSSHNQFRRNNQHFEIYSTAFKEKASKYVNRAVGKPVNIRRCGKVMRSMLHRTYWNMKERELVCSSKASPMENVNTICEDSIAQHSRVIDFVSLEETFYPTKVKLSKGWRNEGGHSTPFVTKSADKILNSKELFFHKMYLKYQDPSAKTTTYLTNRFPNPAQLYKDVVGPLMEAEGCDLPEPVLTSHLRQVYWKACLSLPWCPIITASHPERNSAVQGVFLRACEQLERLGLLWLDKDRQWQPMSCDKVVAMLELLNKYIDSSFVAPKGRGFKIILKQAKQIKDEELAVTDQNQSCDAHRTCENCNVFNAKLSTTSDLPTSNSRIKESRTLGQVDCQTCINLRPLKAKWKCTVHVGWPFPFTVHAHSISLPGAQLLGYMKVVGKLKTLGLLSSCNSVLSPQVLARLMRMDLQSHWEKSIGSALDHTLQQKFAADAELFCDASFTGFGAYVVFKDSEKVRWLCESWEEHDKTFQGIIYPRQWMFESTLAELYTTVTSIYSWKKRLRGKRLLCFSDSQATVGLINSYMEKPGKEEVCLCVNALDRLVASLQATCCTYSITLQAVWLDRNKNTLADKLSRRDTETFKNSMSHAACKKSRAKKLSIPWAQYKSTGFS
ncbi:hypothetical protein PoB_004972900 [Plakobranchus ocellatus]|uniref:RNase H type-1 domain-containing protein n=1 Tax=Plakobranchus ocellatus TaxID=259542 RepID=A0AAV4BSS1_9GAST|nr:hypothetical protein PoB_004972900 [Plakobranchus ocellatus]